MSKSIRELMVEAGMQFRLDSTSAQIENGIASFEELYVYDKFDPLKYAELIVEECILTIQMGITRDGHDTEKYQRSMKHIRQIKEHFGVSE